MSKPLLFIDLETTGIDPQRCAPVSIACVVLGGPDHGAVFRETMRPHDGATINDIALTINGYSRDQLATFQPPDACYNKFKDFVGVLDAGQTVTTCHQAAGWNFKFDRAFMEAWSARHGAQAWFAHTFEPTDIEASEHFRRWCPAFKTDPRFGNWKLVTAYRGIFGADYKDAHNELADCYATRDIFLHCDKHGAGDYADYHYLLDRPTTSTTNTAAPND